MSRQKDESVPHTNPLDRILRRKSPFDGLFAHAAKVAEAVRVLEPGCTEYANGRFGAFTSVVRQLRDLEHQADLIRAQVRAHLPRHLFMSVARDQFEALLGEQDDILDAVADLVERMEVRPTPIPEDLKERFLGLVSVVLETVTAYEKAVEVFADVLATGFGGSARDEAKNLVKQVHLRESEGDVARMEFLREVYAREDRLKPLDVVHLALFADLLDNVADAAETAAERLRTLVAE